MKSPYLLITDALAKNLPVASLVIIPLLALPVAQVSPATQAQIDSAATAAAAGIEYSIGNLHITAPWMRATPKGASVASGYMTLTNTGNEPDRLLSVESDIASTVEVHEMSKSGEVMKMRPLEKPLEIEPGGVVELKPSGLHLMFSRLKQGVSEGDKVTVTMVFEKAGKIDVELPAAGIAANGPSGPGTMQGHKM